MATEKQVHAVVAHLKSKRRKVVSMREKAMNQCNEQALFRYTWAGRDEEVICLQHAAQLKEVARVIGYHLQIIPLSKDEQLGKTCSQKIK